MQIPIMFYATVVLLPTFIVIYFVAGRKKKVVPLRSADPALVLRAQGVNVRRALTSNMLLGIVYGLVVSLVIFVVMIGVDWYYSTGLFAVDLPYATFPPKVSDVLPPHPPSYAKSATDNGGGSDTIPNSNNNSNSQTDQESTSGDN